MIPLFKKESRDYKFLGYYNDINSLFQSNENFIHDDLISNLIKSEIVSSKFNHDKYAVLINKETYFINSIVGDELCFYYTDLLYDNFSAQSSYGRVRLEMEDLKLKLMFKDNDQKNVIIKTQLEKALEKLHANDIGREFSLLDSSLDLNSAVFRDYLTEELCWNFGNLIKYLFLHKGKDYGPNELGLRLTIEMSFPKDFSSKWFDFLEHVMRVKLLLNEMEFTNPKLSQPNNQIRKTTDNLDILEKSKSFYPLTELGHKCLLELIIKVNKWDSVTKKKKHGFGAFCSAFLDLGRDNSKLFFPSAGNNDYETYLKKNFDENFGGKNSKSKLSDGSNREKVVKDHIKEFLELQQK